jgi:hypothetical protein
MTPALISKQSRPKYMIAWRNMKAHHIPFGRRAVEEARTRLADAFMDQIGDNTPLSRDMYEEITG